ncbi:phosphatidylglycerophosphatase A [Bacillus sp. NP157]|nr:phosphatidylglycerophosphatase A [Bacillus sp. NP157]
MSTKYVLDADARRRLMVTPAGWIATGFGAGLAPRAQGTVGSLVALVPWLALHAMPVWAWLLLIAASFALGVWACNVAGRLIGVDDHRSLVWDEFVGQWIALLPVLVFPGLAWVVLGFVLFRVFDVWKPWPIGWFDRRVKGGLGVMLDDVIAGLFAAIALHLVQFIAFHVMHTRLA